MTGVARPRAVDWSLVILLALSCWLVQGYAFPHVNHGQEIPPVYALLDPTMFANDFAAQDFLGPNPRTLYQYGLAGLVRLVGSVGTALFLLNILAHLAFFAGLIGTVRALLTRLDIALEPRIAQAGIAFVAIAAMLSPLSWGSRIFQSEAVPATFAMAIAIWSFVWALRACWLLAFALAGLATLLQFLIGLYTGLVLLPALAFAAWQQRRWQIAPLPVLAWILPAIALFLWMRTGAKPVPPGFDFLDVFGRFRVPHHWFPSTASGLEWACDALLLVAGGLALRTLARHRPEARAPLVMLGGMILVAVLGTLANVLFVELLPITLIGKLQLQRLMPFGHLAIFLAIGAALAARPKLGADSRRDVHLALGLAVLPLVFTGLELASPGTIALIVAGAALASFIAHRPSPLAYAAPVLLAALLLVAHWRPAGLLSDGLQYRLERRYDPLGNRPIVGDKLARFMIERSPKSALLLHSPEWDNFTSSFSMRAERAAYVSFKNVPYTDHGVAVWQRRMERVIDRPIDGNLDFKRLRPLWRERNSADLEALGRDVGACWLMDRVEDRQAHFGAPLVTDRIGDTSWGIWKIGNCADAPAIEPEH
ncbi:DUF6798 domain-containing protein [Sphingomicrobium sp. XHP0239]|uniref:DUF6798 domain-containing protein n=1 Tax=Sphingomicrobium maritimum TaxID=3133972 RepID=UPI0031CCD8AD